MDYKQFSRGGHPIEDIESYLSDEDLELFQTTSDDDLVHVWGTSVDGTWRNVERNDIALVYHDGEFIARGQVLQLRHDPDLAEYLWRENVEHGRWNEESPWEYMTFLTDVEEVDVDIEEFNDSLAMTRPTARRDLLESPTSASTNSPEKSRSRPPLPT